MQESKLQKVRTRFKNSMMQRWWGGMPFTELNCYLSLVNNCHNRNGFLTLQQQTVLEACKGYSAKYGNQKL